MSLKSQERRQLMLRVSPQLHAAIKLKALRSRTSVASLASTWLSRFCKAELKEMERYVL